MGEVPGADAASLGDLAAREMSSATAKLSPALGTTSRPETSTGVDGPARSIERPLSLKRARTRPKPSPQTMTSPTCNVPSCTRTVATTPRPSESEASRQVPVAGRARVGLQLVQIGESFERGQELGDSLAGRRRSLDDLDVAAPLDRVQALLRSSP